MFILNGLSDEILPYLNINNVISKLLVSPNKDIHKIKPLIWDYAQEQYYRNRPDLALDVMEKYYFQIIDKSEESNALEFTAICSISLKDTINALNILRELKETPKINFLIFKAKLISGVIDTENVKKLLKSYDNPIEIVKEILDSEIDNLEDILQDLSEPILDYLDTEKEIEDVLHCLCEKAATEGSLLRYLPIALEKLTGENLK